MKNSLFTNKIIVITGAGSGLGMGLSLALAELGAILVLADINAQTLDDVVQKAKSMGGQASGQLTDTRIYEQVKNLIETTVATHQHIDYLFNNAGIGIASECQDISIDDWHKVIDVNLMGMVYGCEIGYKQMVKQGFGHIVNTASLAAIMPFPTAVPYATSKFAVLGMSRSLRIEGEKLGVKVSAICPGFVQTEIYNNAIRQLPTQQLMKAIVLPVIGLDQAIHAILKGVAANKSMIVFPFYSRLLWFVTRLFPALADIVGRDAIGKFRNLKKE
jgi:NAD(P)-dependent dehydrogenase (short-subunit alcohol dehydrogenase family)